MTSAGESVLENAGVRARSSRNTGGASSIPRRNTYDAHFLGIRSRRESLTIALARASTVNVMRIGISGLRFALGHRSWRSPNSRCRMQSQKDFSLSFAASNFPFADVFLKK